MKWSIIISIFSVLLFSSCNSDDDDKGSQANQLRNQSRTAESNKVTNTYGELEVELGSVTYEASYVPWSSWWYPVGKGELFKSDSGLAPLEKYDLFMSRQHREYSESADYEDLYIFNNATAAWEGLCHSWAVASVLYNEPKVSRSFANIDFTVADRKALLIKSYEDVRGLEIYGDRYDGNATDNYQDVYPDQYHRFTQYWLGEKKLPFLMDYDASFPVWTVPVYNVKFDIKKESDTSVLVTSWMTYASPFVEDKNFVGTKRSVKFYNYRLKGNFISENRFSVVDGEWLEASVDDHPDYLIDFPAGATKGTFNDEVDVEIATQLSSVKKRQE